MLKDGCQNEKGDFDLADMEKQLLNMLKMGGMGGLMKMIPGVQKLQQQLKICQLMIKRYIIKLQLFGR